ncbi:MAG: hypothetical protein P8078_13030, partial [bacterium]
MRNFIFIFYIFILFLLKPIHSVLFAQSENWQLPPTSLVNTQLHYPKLVNYFHRKLSESQVPERDERLAQWDVVILNPDFVINEEISLSTMRTVNSSIKILCWIPLQGPGSWSSLYSGFDTSWYCKDTSGNTVMTSGGNPIANPFADNYGYVHHILDYINQNTTDYNGVMYDCLWENPPREADINQDGILNEADQDLFRSAHIF